MNLEKISFEFNHLRIDTSKIDKFIDLANTEFDVTRQQYVDALQNQESDHRSLNEACKAGNILFSIYALGILHCYSLLENNRKAIIARKLNLLENKSKKYYRKDEVEKVLKDTFQIEHKTIKNSDHAEEFRNVNNALKHSRFAYSQNVIVKGSNSISERTYNDQKLRELYEKTPLLNEYLSDLYSKIESVQTNVACVPRTS